MDKYIPYPLFVTKEKKTPKVNHADDLKTMKEDCDTFCICTYEFGKRDITLEPMCQASQKVCYKHLLFIGI